MLRFTVKAGEYFNIGDDIRVVILGGCANNCRVMVDAPKEYNIVRGRVLERRAVTPEEKEKLGHYYPEPKLSREAMRRLIAKQQREKQEEAYREAGEEENGNVKGHGAMNRNTVGREDAEHWTEDEAGLRQRAEEAQMRAVRQRMEG